MEEQTLYTKYALLTPSDYFKLNESLSEKMGYTLGNASARLAPMVAPIDINGLWVMTIPTDVQEQCADLLPTLVDGFTLSEDVVVNVEATGLTTQQVDWILNHTAATNPPIEVLYLLDSAPSLSAEQAIQKIVSNGTTVIVSE